MEILTNGRDDALKRLVDGLSTLIASAETIKHEEESFRRYSEHMIHVRDLLPKLQSQQATIDHALLLQRMEAEVNKARAIIEGYKSRRRLLRPVFYRFVVSRLEQSSKEINDVLQILRFAQMKTVLNIKETADDIIHGMESLQLNLSSNATAILSSLDKHISENSGNQQQTTHCLFTWSKCIASSSVCPLPIRVEAEESEVPPSSFFLCPLTAKVLEDPVSVCCDHSFERKAIEDYFHGGHNLCPLCSKELSSTGKLEVTSNSTLRNSILEWKKREEKNKAERNAKRKLMDAAARITLDNMENTNRALGDLHALMKEIPSCISVATETSCKLVPKLADLLKNSSENTSMVLECLLLIARFSEENKEIVGKRGVIKCLLKECVTEPTAVAVLMELSRNKAVAGKIGGITYSIPSLISFLDKPAVAETARGVLKNLSIDINSIVIMAKFGYFTPFLEQFNSQEISEETRANMAEGLSQIQLTETSARNLENELFIGHLTEMLSCDFPCSKMASLNCIKQFMAFNELRTSFLQNECAIPALLCLITSKIVEEELKQKALEILISLIQTTQPMEYQSNPVFQTLFSSNSLQDMIEQIKTSAPEVQALLLRLLLIIVQNSNAAGEWIVSDHNAMNCLFSAIDVEQNSKVKVNALKLIYYIAGNHHIAYPLPPSPSKESIVGSLITTLTGNQIDEELSAAAAGILIRLPADDQITNELLQNSALKFIHAVITHASNSHLLLENALGLLLRCINQSQSSSEFQKKVCKLARTDLIQILSTGSPAAKQRVAMILVCLSGCTVDSPLITSSSLSSHFIRHGLVYLRRSVKEEDGCPVHTSSCDLQRFICLVMDRALKPLIEMVKTMECGETEAALMALDTLFDTGCDFNGAATAIVESHGATPILEVLEKGELSVKGKALELFSKIYEHSGITKKELDRFKGLLLNIVRNEDGLKDKAEKLLKNLVGRLDHYGLPV